MGAQQAPYISVIIPAFNEERHLGAVLDAVLAQRYPRERYQVLVVDNGSTDATREIAGSRAIAVLSSEGPVGRVRNVGALHATGEVLAFLDADCLPDVGWLAAGARSLEQEECITGAPYELPQDATWVESVWFSQKAAGRRHVPHINAGNLFIRKAVFSALGGFDERLKTGEDAELCARARQRWPVVADDSIRVFHLGNPKTLRQFLRREIWLGLGAFGTFRIQRWDKPLIGTVMFACLTALQVIGAVQWAITGSACLLVGASLGLGSLLAATLFSRRRFLTNVRQSLQLALLYYVYFLGRSIGLVFLATGTTFYHHNKQAAA